MRAKFDKFRIPAVEAFLNVAEADCRMMEPFAKAMGQTNSTRPTEKNRITASGLKSSPNLPEWI
jgi:hypothetical protein